MIHMMYVCNSKYIDNSVACGHQFSTVCKPAVCMTIATQRHIDMCVYG